MKIVSGIQSTDSLTLGNYIGAIKPLIKLQKNNELIIFIADLHSITMDFNPVNLIKSKLNIAKIYLASGIKKENAIIFNQSEVFQHLELSWILTCHTNLGQLNRMTQFKDKSHIKEQNKTTRIPAGLLMYPVLMASDILLYSPDIVPVGNDQKQHIELTRDIAMNFNSKYNSNVFKVPDFFSHENGGRIMDLQNPLIKMSKSNEKKDGVIFLLDSEEEIFRKIKFSKTDSLNKICFDMTNQRGLSNLLSIYASLTDKSINNIVEKFKDYSYKDFKDSLAELIWKSLKKIQDKYNNIDDENIKKILKSGASKAQKIALAKLLEVKRQIGLINE
mgnify:CR=1 FL=1